MTEDPARAAAPFDLSWDEGERVVRFVWDDGSICDEAAARRGTELILAMGKGSVPLLVDMRRMRKLERSAREYYKTNKGDVSGMALLVGSPVTKMLANFFMRTDTDTTPTRMFTDESVALRWLHEPRP